MFAHTQKLFGCTGLALFIAAMALMLCCACPAFADETALTTTSTADAAATTAEEHYLGFASDLHSTEDTLEGAFGNFPNNPEYVSLVGDMVGARGGDAPAFLSSDILARIRAISTCENIAADGSNASIVWADHDAGVTDDAGIVKGMGDPAGYTSGQVYEGKNGDGSTAYYIYVVGFYHMLKGGEISQEAAQSFKSWVADKDVTVPVIVMCHAPLVAKRGDNYGATYWNEALNYAATGVAGISTAEQTDIPIIRNVVFLSGHNHTVDPAEYVYTVGSVMNVQIDTSSGLLGAEQEEGVVVTEAYDEEIADLAGLAAGESHTPNVSAAGKDSVVYYTALTPGYLKTSGSATLLTIAGKTITFAKYNAEGQTDLGVTADGKTVASPLVVNRITKDEDKSSQGNNEGGNKNDNSSNDSNSAGENSANSSSSKAPAKASATTTEKTTSTASTAKTADTANLALLFAIVLSALALAAYAHRKQKDLW